MPKSLSHRLLCILSTFFLLVSCYEKQEGCLNIRAENYDFGADEPCDDCCTFPTMSVRVIHNWGDTLLFTDSVYTNSLNQGIRLLNAKFYISNIQLLNDENAYSINESIDVAGISGTTSSIIDDITFIQNSRLNYAIGSFENAQDFTGLAFTFGINGNYTAEDEGDSFIQDENFFDEDQFIHTNFKMDYVLESLPTDTLTLTLNDINTTKDIFIPGNFELPLGIDFSLILSVDYEALLKDINFEKMEEEYAKILENLSDFFHI
jgi:hypothetical protein